MVIPQQSVGAVACPRRRDTVEEVPRTSSRTIGMPCLRRGDIVCRQRRPLRRSRSRLCASPRSLHPALADAAHVVDGDHDPQRPVRAGYHDDGVVDGKVVARPGAGVLQFARPRGGVCPSRRDVEHKGTALSDPVGLTGHEVDRRGVGQVDHAIAVQTPCRALATCEVDVERTSSRSPVHGLMKTVIRLALGYRVRGYHATEE